MRTDAEVIGALSRVGLTGRGEATSEAKFNLDAPVEDEGKSNNNLFMPRKLKPRLHRIEL